MSELDLPMIFRKRTRILPDSCAFCAKSKTFCDGLQDRRDGECCCQSCELADRDPH